jgi:acyl-CoA thioester hydrolase
VGQPFRHQLRVRYGECDAQGVVFNANYLAYFDTNTNELLRAALGSYLTMLDRGVDIVVAEAQLRFRAPARFEDQLTLEIAVSQLGTTSITTVHRISRNGELLVEGTVRYVMVDPAAMSKTPIPDWLREELAPWTVPEPGADSDAGADRAAGRVADPGPDPA